MSSITKTTKVSQARARRYLKETDAAGFLNRKINRTRVELYKRSMASGSAVWDAHTSTIHVSVDGILINGQHRMIACAESGVPLECVLIVVANPDLTMAVVDTGKSRTAADVLGIHHIVYPRTKSTLTRMYLSYEASDGYCFDRLGLTPLEVLDYVVEHDADMTEAVEIGKLPGVKNFSSSARLGFLAYIAEDRECIKRFFREVVDGERADGTGLGKTDPARVLRERLLQSRAASRDRSSPAKTISAAQEQSLIVRAYGVYKLGRKVRRLQLPKGTPGQSSASLYSIVDTV